MWFERLAGPITPTCQVCRAVPEGIGAVIDRGLSPAAQARYPDFRPFARALDGELEFWKMTLT